MTFAAGEMEGPEMDILGRNKSVSKDSRLKEERLWREGFWFMVTRHSNNSAGEVSGSLRIPILNMIELKKFMGSVISEEGDYKS